MIFKTWALLFFALLNISFSSLVYLKNKKNLRNICYATFMSLVGIWSFGLFMFYFSSSKSVDIFWSKFIYFAGSCISVSFFFVSLTLPTEKPIKTKLFFWNLASLLALFILFFFTPLMIKNINYIHGVKTFIYGQLHLIFDIHFSAYFALALIKLFHALKSTSGQIREQIKYVLLSTFIGVTFNGLTNITMPSIFHNCSLVWAGPYVTFVMVSIMFYAIARYRLMDINIAIRKVITNLILLIFIAGIIIALYISPTTLILKCIGILTLTIFITVYLPIIKHLLENFINQVLYGSKYDYQETLAEVSNKVPTIIVLDKLLKYITDKICNSMGIKKGTILLKDERGKNYSLNYQHGFNDEALSSIKLESNTPLITRLKSTEDVLVRHEMARILDKNEYNELCVELDKFDAEVVVPIKKGENLIGFITLCNKAGGDTFGAEDYRLLHIIAIQAAVAIENIRLYNKLIHTDRQTFLETLSSGVSHELRNRLVAIRTFIDLFPDRVDTKHVEAGYLEFRDLAVREMERLTKIIDGLLSYSRAVSRGGEELNVNALLNESFLIIQSKLKEKDISLDSQLDEKVSTIKGDKGRLLQVFINIMQNGADAMEPGGKLIITSVEKDNEIEVFISDNGKGIDKDHLDAIFEPFFTTKHTGTGLGLSIVQRIVRDHNGEIRVDSELGKGTTFTIIFAKGAEYQPADVKAKKELGYWEVKKEYEGD